MARYENFNLITTPKPMNYLETITQIARHNNITLKESVKLYYDITGIPSKEYYKAIKDKNDLLPYGTVIKITSDPDILGYWGIPLEFMEKSAIIDAINIVKESDGMEIYYCLKGNDYLFFGRPTIMEF